MIWKAKINETASCCVVCAAWVFCDAFVHEVQCLLPEMGEVNRLRISWGMLTRDVDAVGTRLKNSWKRKRDRASATRLLLPGTRTAVTEKLKREIIRNKCRNKCMIFLSFDVPVHNIATTLSLHALLLTLLPPQCTCENYWKQLFVSDVPPLLYRVARAREP